MKLNEIGDPERIFALFASRSGDGKSSAAASFPKPFYQMDFDMRIRGVKASTEQGWLSGDGIEFDQFAPSPAGFDAFERKISELEMLQIQGRFPYKTIEIASLFSLSRLMIVKSHTLQKGKKIGNMRMSGPADFGFEVSAIHQTFDSLRQFPCNIILSAHVIDRWGKPQDDDGKVLDPLAPNAVLGSKLTVRDQLGESILAYFDDVYQLSREMKGNNLKFYAEFSNDMAKNSFGIPPGKFDITKKPFYNELQELIKKVKAGELVAAPTTSIFG
jgi:hypothetical protein